MIRHLVMTILMLGISQSALAATCVKTLRSFGAVGNGSADDSIALRKALSKASNSAGCALDGENRRYAVKGSIRNNGLSVISLSNAQIFQTENLNVDTTRTRTLFLSDARVSLKNVLVHRGPHERAGLLGESSAIFLYRANSSNLEDVSVTGNGYGAGIWIADSSDVTVVRPKIYDMKWSAPSAPRYEQLFGIWLVRTNRVKILSATVRNLLGEYGDNVYRPWQTDGIDLSMTQNTYISSAYIENVGEGIDFTGSNGNFNFEVADSTVVNADAWAFKFANSAVGGLIRNSHSYRAGFGGFVVSGPTEPNLPYKASNITFIDCKAFDTGVNSVNRWNALNTSGFFVMQGSYDPEYPKNIRIINSLSVGSSDGRTKFGFLSQVPLVGAYNLSASNSSVEGASGLRTSGYGLDFINSESQRILGCKFPFSKQLWYFDQSYANQIPWDRARITADFEDLRRRGLGCQ